MNDGINNRKYFVTQMNANLSSSKAAEKFILELIMKIFIAHSSNNQLVVHCVHNSPVIVLDTLDVSNGSIP